MSNFYQSVWDLNSGSSVCKNVTSWAITPARPHHLCNHSTYRWKWKLFTVSSASWICESLQLNVVSVGHWLIFLGSSHQLSSPVPTIWALLSSLQNFRGKREGGEEGRGPKFGGRHYRLSCSLNISNGSRNFFHCLRISYMHEMHFDEVQPFSLPPDPSPIILKTFPSQLHVLFSLLFLNAHWVHLLLPVCVWVSNHLLDHRKSFRYHIPNKTDFPFPRSYHLPTAP